MDDCLFVIFAGCWSDGLMVWWLVMQFNLFSLTIKKKLQRRQKSGVQCNETRLWRRYRIYSQKHPEVKATMFYAVALICSKKRQFKRVILFQCFCYMYIRFVVLVLYVCKTHRIGSQCLWEFSRVFSGTFKEEKHESSKRKKRIRKQTMQFCVISLTIKLTLVSVVCCWISFPWEKLFQKFKTNIFFVSFTNNGERFGLMEYSIWSLKIIYLIPVQNFPILVGLIRITNPGSLCYKRKKHSNTGYR